MTILVTGAAGFIGSNFVRQILERHSDYRVVCFDKLTYAGNLENLSGLEGDPRFAFERGDICDASRVRMCLHRYEIDTVVHFAAETHVDRSIAGADAFIQTNVVGTNVLLGAAKEAGVRTFVQVSTDEVYGSLGPTGMFTEASPLRPGNPYAASKASADLLALSYHRTFGLPVVITRCSNNYGPYQFPEKLIPLMITHAIDGKPLPVYGDGGNVRDWLHVSDHCAALDAVLHRGVPGEVYNIGGGAERTNLDIVRRILASLGKSESLIAFVPDRPGHDRRYATDASKLHRELGWTPERSFDQALEETVDWYAKNDGWWRRILNGEYASLFARMYGGTEAASRKR